MIREYRYIVLKRKDVKAALTEDERGLLNSLCGKISDYRIGEGKAPLECVVVESDWPEYETTWESIELRVDSLQDCTCRARPAGPTDISPPEIKLDEWCPVHGRDPDYERGRAIDDRMNRSNED